VPREKKTQMLKPATAARKLGVLLSATPDEFQSTEISREEFNALTAEPPTWLVELRKVGPHPRTVVSERLGVSTSGLARAGVPDSMTTAQIDALLEAPPAWLIAERRSFREVRNEEARIAARKAEKAGSTE
jgi:hypothetical protein